MGLVSQAINNICGGVSQAPPQQRDDSQYTEQINALPLFNRKVARRPPLLHTAVLDPTDLSGGFVHRLGDYNILVTAGVVKIVHVLSGAIQTLYTLSGLSYLTGGILKGTTVGDTAFLLNTSTATARGASTGYSSALEAFLYFRQGDFGTTYTVTLDGLTVSYTTPNNTGPADKPNTTTIAIATAMRTALQTDATVAGLFSVDIYGSTLRIAKQDGSDFAVSGSDGLGDSGMVVIKGAVQQFADLPDLARPGTILQVTGDSATAFDNYYVQYSASNFVGEKGTWKEVVKPGASLGFDPSTLPVRIVKNGDLLKMAAAYQLPIATTQRPIVANQTAIYIPTTAATPNGGVVDAVYPKGSVYTVFIYVAASPGVVENSYSYTVLADTEDATTVAAGLAAIINPTAPYTASSSGNTLLIGRTVPAFPGPICRAEPTWDKLHNAWSPSITMVPGEHVGRSFYNLTKNVSGVITANTTKAITVGASTSNFDPGDILAVRIDGATYFVLDECPWESRAAGDDITNPFPSFTSHAPTDIFVHQGRLGFIFGSSVVLSRAGDLYNFFRETVTEILSSDPIDISGSATGVTSFHSALEWNEQCYLWTESAQYLLGGDPLTPTTVSLTKVSAYLNSATIRPVVAGQRVFFVALRSGFIHLMDYHTKGYQKVHEATDLGLHIPRYLQGNAVCMAVDDAQGIVLLNTDTNSGQSIYCYAYKYDEQDQLIQRAWGRWDFSAGRVLAMDIVDGVAALVMAYTAGTCLNSIVFDPAEILIYEGYDLYTGVAVFDGTDTFDGGGGITYGAIPAYLDRHIQSTISGVTSVFDGVNTTWTLPYSVDVTGTEGILTVVFDNPADAVVTSRPAPNQVSAAGDQTALTAHIGVLYTTTSVLSTFYLRDKGVADTRGRLQLRWLEVDYEDLTSLTITVAAAGRTACVYSKTSRLLGNGTMKIPIQSLNEDCTITITVGSAGADALVSYSWEGTYYTRERRL